MIHAYAALDFQPLLQNLKPQREKAVDSRVTALSKLNLSCKESVCYSTLLGKPLMPIADGSSEPTEIFLTTVP